MARTVFTARLNRVDKKFEEIGNAIQDILKNNEDVKKETSLKLAEELANKINEKYIQNLNRISDAGYVHGTGKIKTSIDETKNGYVVKIRGNDVLYEEYGTGTVGIQHPHPRHKIDGMKPYGSGRNIVHNGTRKDGTTPHWYQMYRDFPGGLNSKGELVRGMENVRTDFGNAPIKSSDYVWKHNGIITKGLPAGKFVYDSCQELRKSTGLGDKTVLGRTIKQAIKNDFVNQLDKKSKYLGKTESKQWSADDLQKRFAALRVFGGR